MEYDLYELKGEGQTCPGLSPVKRRFLCWDRIFLPRAPEDPESLFRFRFLEHLFKKTRLASWWEKVFSRLDSSLLLARISGRGHLGGQGLHRWRTTGRGGDGTRDSCRDGDARGRHGSPQRPSWGAGVVDHAVPLRVIL